MDEIKTALVSCPHWEPIDCALDSPKGLRHLTDLVRKAWSPDESDVADVRVNWSGSVTNWACTVREHVFKSDSMVGALAAALLAAPA